MTHQLMPLALGLAAAVCIDAGLLLLKVRGDRAAGAAEGRAHASLECCARDPVWLLGLLLQPLGYGLYLWALELAPLHIVQAVMSSGVIIFVLFAVGFLGERLTGFEWGAIASVVAGMILLGLSLTPDAESGRQQSDPQVVLYLSLAVVGLSALTWYAPPILGMPDRRGEAIAIASGLLLGLASIYARGLALVIANSRVGEGLARAAISPYAFLTLLANLVGFALLLAAFREGRASIVLALSATLSNVVPILAAMLALGERLPADDWMATSRVLALLLTLGGAALLVRLSPPVADR
jgi:uncharacterized membrane protein